LTQLEIGSALAKTQFRQVAVHLPFALRADPHVEVVPLSDPLLQAALDLFAKRQDKEWSLTDCISFVVMQTRVRQ